MRISDWSSDVCSSDLAAAELVDRDDALLEEVVGDRGNPALVVAHLVVGAGAELLDAAAQLVGGDEAALGIRQQAQDGVDPLLPGRVVVLAGFHGAGRQAAHVVVAAQQEMGAARAAPDFFLAHRSEEHTSELQSLMRISYAVFC